MVKYFSAMNVEQIAEGLESRKLTTKDVINVETLESKVSDKSYFMVWYTETNK